MTSFPTYALPDHVLSRPIDILAIGGAKLEMILQVSAWPAAGGQHDSAIPKPIYSAGGCAANVACVASRLGSQTALISRIGDGRYSSPVLSIVKDSGVDTSYIKTIPNEEGQLLINMTNPAGDWTVLSYEEPILEIRVEDIPPAGFFETVKIVHIDGFSFRTAPQKEAVEEAIARARQGGCLVSIDAAVPTALGQPDYLATLCTQCDFVFANLAESMAIMGVRDSGPLMEEIQKMNRPLFCLKLGELGAKVITPDGIGMVAPYAVEVVDTTAAGDSFIAALLSGLCQKKSLAVSAARASAAGALACLGAGSQSHQFTMEDIHRLIDSQKTH